MKTRRLIPLFLLTIFALVFSTRAEVRLPALFSHHMVLQQSRPLPVWGWADDGEEITVRFRGHTEKTVARNLHWRVTLPALKPGKAGRLEIVTRAQHIILTNVVVGEVWVCSGQSNMEWSMARSHEPEADIATATNRDIRVFLVPKNRMGEPTTRIDSAWKTSSPEDIKAFSAVGYYFGRALEASRDVPVGLIGTYWGGTPAQAWMKRESLEINPRYNREILAPAPEAMEKWREACRMYEAEKAAAGTNGQEFKKQAPRQPWIAGELYNGMIAPLIPYAIRGAIWYQGEANAGRAEQYRTLFADMIRCWRYEWSQGDFPFLCVQLAPYDHNKRRPLEEITRTPGDSTWAELREAQWLATKTLPRVGMAVITDLGDKDDIHPTRKQPVGERLALAARNIAYGERLEYSGPLYRDMKPSGHAIELHFDHVGKGLEARGGTLTGFAICGEDRKFVWADAKIVGDRVVVSSPDISQPVAVRYGWADYPVVNLWNKDGLPASPFRTDDFPLVTAAKP